MDRRPGPIASGSPNPGSPNPGDGFGGFIPFHELARAFGVPPAAGSLRCKPEDFRVEEELGFEPADAGPHYWLLVRKSGCTTPFTARILADRYASPLREIGFSGLKDRHAITTQWFSVPARPGVPEPKSGEVAGSVRIVRVSRGRRKLRRGVHAGNRFIIVVRGLRGDRTALADRVRLVAREGAPNYFGKQRFGRDSNNVVAAARMLGRSGGRRSRTMRGMYLSAARSLLFNRVLHRRVRSGQWNTWVRGDAILIAGRRRALAPGADPREEGTSSEWVAACRAHPTGPLWGRDSSGEVSDEAIRHEWLALSGCEGWQAGLEAAGVAPARRALRVIPSDLGLVELPGGGVEIRFALPRGSYATAVMREIVRDCRSD